jgi:hypothetical protein
MNIYCGQLGMLIEFSYCISLNENLPCRNIIGCWNSRTDIMRYLKEHFTEEELKEVFNGLPKSRIDRIIDSVRKCPPGNS